MVVGGAERSMLKLAAGIVSRGYPVDLVLSRAEGPFMAEVPKSLRLIDLKARRVLSSLPALIRYLRRERPVAILSVLHANLVALWACRLAAVPTRVVVSERNTLSSEAQYYDRDLRMRVIPKLDRIFYSWADSVVAVSKGVAIDLIQTINLPKESVRVIYNPIVTPDLERKAQDVLTHPWFSPREAPVILSVGRLAGQKDFSTLVRAFAIVRKTHRARLFIIGEGEERNKIESLVRQLGLVNEVSLPGYISNPYPFMRQSTVFVLSSKWEGLPGVLIEAMYCGVPIIATDCPSGPREILDEGRYGQLVPVGDAVTLAGAITKSLNGYSLRPPPGSWRSFELEAVVDQYLQVLLGEEVQGGDSLSQKDLKTC